jgi:hypothetical protein
MKQLFFNLSVLLFIGYNLSAQTVAYQFATSSQEYLTLQNSIPITHEWAPWNRNSIFSIPVGFSFRFCDSVFDTVRISWGSSLYFGNGPLSDNHCLAGFSGAITDLFWIVPGATESLSPVSFENAGIPGSRILKIQWANTGFISGSVTDFINFQIWLYEGSNAIEVHFGPQHITASFVYEGIDETGPVIGFLIPSESEYVYLYGNAGNPTLGYPPLGFKGMEGTPSAGVVLGFIPLINSVPVALPDQFTFFHLQQQHKFFLKNAGTVTQITLTDCSGKTVTDFHFAHPAADIQINYHPPPAGMYFVVVHFSDRPVLTKKIFISS